MFSSIAATPDEIRAAMPGDDLIATPDVVMNRAFSVAATPDAIWPWIAQLGKQRAGWYLPRQVERAVPRRHRAIRTIDNRWQDLAVGDVIPDYGRNETFEVALVAAPHTLVYRSQRGRVHVTWSIALAAEGGGHTRVRLRLALDPIRRKWLAESVGDLFDALTIAGMAAGLQERVSQA